ncbi:aldehyde dehydrogenase family protein [Pseudodesulfovibrio cashew]|uniref:Aldehyde dehydrogenase family protein n=1 Tax=Pseudodesulfovibrio cashew TaxID=2678688 RepID=A0A6I6JCY4_9BACT|nr:aldehyde dehydrogenase family protein [Pseudodesulfovibrio cashew]QGY39009.1 aldehyde dehydrogenase family protein [Pseudodesulfovibrio cashew]
MNTVFPDEIGNWVAGGETFATGDRCFDKVSPHNGQVLCSVTRSDKAEVAEAVRAARRAWPMWSNTNPVQRGQLLHDFAMGIKARREEVAAIVAAETGKAPSEALGETDGAIALALFYAGEGQRLYGRTTTSGVDGKSAMTVRQPLGVAGLIVAANTPIANVAWKIFPALICGNTVVLKAAEDTPATAWIVGSIAKVAGLPDGVLNIVQGYGEEAGTPLVENPEVDVVSFTGSTAVGRRIATTMAKRLGRVSLELGGKNALVVCDDADMDNAVKWALLSAFSNAGQRCAAASRIVVFESMYEEFRGRFVEAAKKLSLGPTDNDDLGPVINRQQLESMESAVERALAGGARLLTGGQRLDGDAHQNGCYMMPTILEKVGRKDELSKAEVFGPVTVLYSARDFHEAVEIVNDSPYGLTAAIHTKSVHRTGEFVNRVQTGVVMINAGTYGSEPHMPFGGLKLSGNGTREPGTEALDVYSNLKDVYTVILPDLV